MYRLAVSGQHIAHVGAVGDLIPLVVHHIQQLGGLAVKDDPQTLGVGVRLGAQGDIGAAIHQNAVVLRQEVLLFQRGSLQRKSLGVQLGEGQGVVLLQQSRFLRQQQTVAGLERGGGAGGYAVFG